MAKGVRVALIGCGDMGRQHLEVLQRLEGFEVAALCDVSAEALQRVGEQYRVAAWYQDYEQLLEEVRPDISAVVTQTRGHVGPVVAALRRGISVLCEKPIAIDLAEADQMVAAAAASGAKLA
ncbi:MAG: Gfo/Idh/MocA family oxidoreductase, partial [Candidatus Latescibacteria bacterium]|nr:Gfo/Idh/MocA family oxidoreductase [Candidatus Latescibacterota bacterium]